ncbi:MAG: hypothetical protein A2173_03140 [Planctomycetes bacterium RBG_13_44_8b]|nr:MAG: hypothetical protein A2173_03140 [Planctomycetes bacterium RBG_13_44_8b]
MAEQKNLAQCCDGLLFLNIFKTFRTAIQPARILTAFFALTLLFVAGWQMDFSKTVIVSGKVTRQDLGTSELTGSLTWPTELHCFVGAPERFEGYIERYKDKPYKQGVFKVWSSFCIARLNRAAASIAVLRFDNFVTSLSECILAAVWALKYHTLYSIILFVIALILFSAAGGAICRGAALQFSRDERCGITPCIKFALKKFISLFCAPLAPMIFIAVCGLVVLVFGLIANIPWAGEILLAIAFIFVLIAGLCMALAIIGAAGGINLMPSVIVYENSDAFDAVNKSCSYVYTKPWRFSFYALLAAVYGAVCYLFVRFFAFLMLAVSRLFLSIIIWTDGSKAERLNKLDVIWPKPEFFNLLGDGLEISRNLTESFAAGVIYLFVLVVTGLIIAFVISFYFSAGTIIYCLLRNKIDNTPLDNVFIEAEQTAQLEQAQSDEQSG